MPKEIIVKSALNVKKQRDSWFLDDYTFNPYSSCAFNCLYCYIRGSKYGENLASSLSVKINAIELLDKALSHQAQKGKYGYIVISSATDPYLRIEEDYRITRQALEVILHHRFPVHMITKSDLILRDLDLLAAIDEQAILPPDLKTLGHGALITFSFATLRDTVGKVFEPGAPSPSRRLAAVQTIKQSNFLTGISFMPLLPYISDTTEELEHAYHTFKDIGVDYVMPATLTLFGNGKGDSKTLMLQAVSKHYPELLPTYQKLFANGHQLPVYYQQAFYQKMKQMAKDYRIRDRIV